MRIKLGILIAVLALGVILIGLGLGLRYFVIFDVPTIQNIPVIEIQSQSNKGGEDRVSIDTQGALIIYQHRNLNLPELQGFEVWKTGKLDAAKMANLEELIKVNVDSWQNETAFFSKPEPNKTPNSDNRLLRIISLHSENKSKLFFTTDFVNSDLSTNAETPELPDPLRQLIQSVSDLADKESQLLTIKIVS